MVAFAENEILTGGSRYNADAETQNYYVRNRYYLPTLGRWLTRDPIGYQGGINLYEYAFDAPSTRLDPSGLQGWGAPPWGSMYTPPPTSIAGTPFFATGSGVRLLPQHPTLPARPIRVLIPVGPRKCCDQLRREEARLYHDLVGLPSVTLLKQMGSMEQSPTPYAGQAMAQRESIDRKKIEMRAATINRALRGVQRQLARNGCGNAYLPEDSAPKSPPDHIIRHPAEEGNLAVEVGAEIIRAVLEEPFEALGIF